VLSAVMIVIFEAITMQHVLCCCIFTTVRQDR